MSQIHSLLLSYCDLSGESWPWLDQCHPYITAPPRGNYGMSQSDSLRLSHSDLSVGSSPDTVG